MRRNSSDLEPNLTSLRADPGLVPAEIDRACLRRRRAPSGRRWSAICVRIYWLVLVLEEGIEPSRGGDPHGILSSERRCAPSGNIDNHRQQFLPSSRVSAIWSDTKEQAISR